MSEIKKEFVSLLKYPSMGLTIIATLICFQKVFHINISNIVHIGPDGFTLQQNTSEAVVALEERVGALEKSKSIDSGDKSALIANYEVSDATAKLSKTITNGDKTILKGFVGYVYLGYVAQQNNEYLNKTLKSTEIIDKINSPDQLVVGGDYIVQGNLVLREGQPPNTNKYFREVNSLGVVPRGTLVTLLDKPVPINRAYATEYWGKIEVKQ